MIPKKSERKFFKIKKALKDRLKADKVDGEKKSKPTNNKKPRPDLPDSFYDELGELDSKTTHQKSWEDKLKERMTRFLSEARCPCAKRFSDFFSSELRAEIERQFRAVVVENAKGSCATLESVAERFSVCSDSQMTQLILSKTEIVRKVRFCRMFCGEERDPLGNTTAEISVIEKSSGPYPKLLRALLRSIGVEHPGKVITELLLGLEKRLVDQGIPLSGRVFERKRWWVQTKCNFLQNPEWVKTVLSGSDAKSWAWKIGNEFTSETYCLYSKEGEQRLKALQDRKEEIENSTDLALLNSHTSSIDGLYTCFKCKGTKTQIYQAQTRGGDEPTTTFCLCVKCGNRWKN